MGGFVLVILILWLETLIWVETCAIPTKAYPMQQGTARVCDTIRTLKMVTLLKQCQESCNDINLSVQATNSQAAGLFLIPYKEVQYANTQETHYLSWLRNIHTCSQDNLFTVEQVIVCW